MLHLQRSTCASGFTLVELLLVLSIIAMFSAMLLPVFATVRERARQTRCLSNLQQIGTAISLYAQDYDERYPLGVTNTKYIDADGGTPKSFIDLDSLPLLKDVLHPYTKDYNLWTCPSDTGSADTLFHINMKNGETVTVPPFPSSFERYGTSYQYHTNLALQQVLYPASAYTYGKPMQQLGPSQVGVMADMLARWHGGESATDIPRRNVLFADGHVKSQKPLQFIACWLRPLEPPIDNGETSPDP